MATISTQLRKFREPTKDELTRIFFSLPPEVLATVDGAGAGKGSEEQDAVVKGQMDINAVLSLGVEGVEDSYVCLISCTNYPNNGGTNWHGCIHKRTEGCISYRRICPSPR